MKKVLITILMSAVALAAIGVTHYYNLPLGEWTRPLMFFPIIYAGAHFRRAGSFSVGFILIICQTPLVINMFTEHPGWSVNYVVTVLAICLSGVFLGHMMQKQRDNTGALEKTHQIISDAQRDVSPEQLLASLENLFREHGQSEQVELYMFDDENRLRNHHVPDSDPLPENHFYYRVAQSGEFLVSTNPAEDDRIRYTGPDNGQSDIAHMAVFSIAYGGRARGVIAVLNTNDERFGKDTMTFLTTIKQSIESVLEIQEINQTAVEHELQREKIRDTFSSYVSRTVAEEILRDPDSLELGGKEQDVTVMFAEVANFIRLIDTLEPAQVIAQLNEYFSAAMDTIFEHEGTIDKFIEDSIMAFWGAPLPMHDAEERAVRCAQEFQQKISDLNQEWERRGRPRFDVCIGINSGPVIAGNIGSIRRMEYTVIGDTVNTAARIKTLSKTRHAPILVSRSTYKKVKDKFTVGEEFKAAVKGKSGEITVYQM